MIYNSFGESFYVKGMDIHATSTFMVVTWPFVMPLLFVISGISTAYALQKRSIREYVLERITKLLIPLVAGILLVVPAQTYFAERFHNGYTGGYFAQYILFFTKETDLSGYSGGFTPGHLWFILYLFIISFAAIPLILLIKKNKCTFTALPLPVILTLFILPLIGSLILDISGKSLGEYLVFFLLGYFLLADENIQIKLEKNYVWLLAIAFVCMITLILGWFTILLSVPDLLYDIFAGFYAWLMILLIIGLGRKYLNINNGFTGYMSHSSFPVYVFHQTWIIVSAYYVFMVTENILSQIILILIFSVIATFVSYEICRRIRITRFLFAIKKRRN
jgi:hypothetical protein